MCVCVFLELGQEALVSPHLSHDHHHGQRPDLLANNNDFAACARQFLRRGTERGVSQSVDNRVSACRLTLSFFVVFRSAIDHIFLTMMASRAVGSFVMLVHVSIILLSFCSNEVMAWQSSSSSSSSSSMMHRAKTTITGHQNINPSADGPEILPSARRELLFLIPKMAATVATATVMLPHRAYAAAPPGMTADAARDQWRNAATTLDDLLQNWSTDKWAGEVGGGDVIRTKLGTQGATSPLFKIEKAFKALRDDVDDAIEFQETTEEFMDALYQADSFANSSNNKTGSGTQTPPAVFIEQSKVEVVKMQTIAKKLNEMVK